jgi:hypothetical protein
MLKQVVHIVTTVLCRPDVSLCLPCPIQTLAWACCLACRLLLTSWQKVHKWITGLVTWRISTTLWRRFLSVGDLTALSLPTLGPSIVEWSDDGWMTNWNDFERKDSLPTRGNILTFALESLRNPTWSHNQDSRRPGQDSNLPSPEF